MRRYVGAKSAISEASEKLNTILIVHEAIAELGTKISTDPPDCKPTFGSIISARIKINLSKPLHRGGWWNTAAGGHTWTRFHWERQSHNLCPKCCTIDHDEDECLNTADNLMIRIFTNEEYIEYIHELSKAYGVEIVEDLDTLRKKICEASKKEKEAENEEEDSSRSHKRSRVEDQENNIEGITENPPPISDFDGMEHDLIEEEQGGTSQQSHEMNKANNTLLQFQVQSMQSVGV
ncbi:uncharacterized protein LOC113313040 [Papaver somniferum]|uniref:uncharacterized protein LOC113313040 n=1 Tax=Papaver somniferum TaxID=3469 RepID=UPI000E6F8050|nr:uncharacterized protein LOC113313040 [Papaver somniferum]